MKLVFAGTRGYIDGGSRRHRMHAALDIAYKKDRIRIDCGADWRGRIDEIRAAAIFVTHAHPDHADGLKDGAPCPVYATDQSWKIMDRCRIEDRRTVPLRTPIRIGEIRVSAFPVIHSTRAPAVGYRVGAGRVAAYSSMFGSLAAGNSVASPQKSQVRLTKYRRPNQSYWE